MVLHMVVQYSSEAVIHLLLDHAADIHEQNNHGQIPLHMAIDRSSQSVVHLLLDRGAAVDGPSRADDSPLHLAIKIPRESIVQLLLDRGADLNVTDSLGRRRLQLAEENGYYSISKVLREWNGTKHGSNTSSNGGMSSVFVCASGG